MSVVWDSKIGDRFEAVERSEGTAYLATFLLVWWRGAGARIGLPDLRRSTEPIAKRALRGLAARLGMWWERGVFRNRAEPAGFEAQTNSTGHIVWSVVRHFGKWLPALRSRVLGVVDRYCNGGTKWQRHREPSMVCHDNEDRDLRICNYARAFR